MSSKKIKITRYKVVNTNIDKKFIGKNLDLQKIKSKSGNGERKPGSTNKITLAKLSNKVDTLANRVDTLTNRVDALTNRVDTLTKNLDSLANRVDTLTKNLDSLANRVDTLANNLNKLAKIVADGFANINHRIDNLVKVNNLKE